MKTISPTLLALLTARPRAFVQCDLYTITLAGGGVSRIAALDVDVTDGVNTWSHFPAIDLDSSRATGHWKTGLDTDTWNFTVLPRAVDLAGNTYPDKLNTVPWLSAARGGMLLGAQIRVERGYLAAWPQPWGNTVTVIGTIVIFLGRVVECDVTRTYCNIVVNDYRDLLSALMPRNLYQAPCRHTLFDAGCGLTAASFAVSGTIGSGSTGNTIYAALAQATGYFTLGRVVMTSGPNSTFGRGVRSWNGTSFQLIAPFPFPLTAGQTFTAYPGCDKAQSTCSSKFSNGANYGGTPFVPVAETAA